MNIGVDNTYKYVDYIYIEISKYEKEPTTMELSTAIKHANKFVINQVRGDGFAGVSHEWIVAEVEITREQALEELNFVDANRVIFDSWTNKFYERYGFKNKRVREIAFLQRNILYITL